MKHSCNHNSKENSFPLDSREILNSYHLKATKPRIEVLSLFLRECRALTHPEVQELLPYPIDRVSIYRTLDSFVEKSILHKVSNDQHIQAFALSIHEKDAEPISEHHAHFKCSICEQIRCIPLQKDLHPNQLQLPINYQAADVELVVHGTCPTCSNENEK